MYVPPPCGGDSLCNGLLFHRKGHCLTEPSKVPARHMNE